MNRSSPSLERRSIDSFFQRLAKQLQHGHGPFSTRKSFAVEKLEFIKEIGSGSYGRVLTAKYLGDIVAVKKLHSLDGTEDVCSSESRSLAEELAKEAETLEQNRSKHIVNLIHYSHERNLLVMEYCNNGSLESVIHNKSKRHIVLEFKNRLKWAWQIAQAMNVMHNGPPSVIHRDLNPANIFLTEYYNIKVGDVGLSKQPFNDSDISSTGSMDGHCMVWQPREVMNERRYSRKSDVYSFAVIMHQLLMIGRPYGFDLPLAELDARVCVHVMSGKGLSVPEDRNLIPGKWHPCLDTYIELMNKCCAPEPEGRPEFDEVCETLAEILEKYKKARMVESVRERISAESLKKVFVISAMVILSLLSASGLLERIGPPWISESVAFNRQRSFLELVCILFGLFCISGSSLCVVGQRRKGICEFFKKRVFKPVKSSFISLHEWFKNWNLQQEDHNLSSKSPFKVGPFSLGPGGLSSDGSVLHLPIPEPELWKEIREAFISELQGNADTGLQAIIEFCQEHKTETLEQREWEDFVRLLSRVSEVTTTEAWRRYQNHLTIPNFFTRGVFSSNDNEPSLEGDHPNALGTGQALSLGFDASTPALHFNEFYAPQLVLSASFSFDRGGQLENGQQRDSEFLPRSFSLAVPAARTEASEI